jgi:hypothetical protein
MTREELFARATEGEPARVATGPLYADFHEIQDDRYLEVDLVEERPEWAEKIREGLWVGLTDGAHTCEGTVVAVERIRRLIYVELDYSTWRSPNSGIWMHDVDAQSNRFEGLRLKPDPGRWQRHRRGQP